MRKQYWRIGVCCVVTLLAATGCINLNPKQDATRFYVLNVPVPEPAAPAPQRRAVSVRTVQIDEYLARPELMVRVGESQVERLSLYRWASNPAVQVQKELQRWSEQYQPGRVFYFPPWTNRPAPTTELAWEIRRMEGVLDADTAYACLELGWSWTEPGKAPVSFNKSWQAEWQDRDPAVLISLLNQLMAQAFLSMMETEPAFAQSGN